MEKTRFIQIDMYDNDYGWQCEECKAVWVYDAGTPKDNDINYCPSCGRKIIEYKEIKE